VEKTHPALVAHFSVWTLQIKTLRENAYSWGSSILPVQFFSREMYGKREEGNDSSCAANFLLRYQAKNSVFSSNFRT